MKTDVEEVRGCGAINFYGFQPSWDKISKHDTSISYGSLIEKSKIKRYTKHLQYIAIKHIADENCGSITGLCKISDGLLVAADNANASIKVINTETSLVSAVVTLEDNPFAITDVGNNTIAVTVPVVKKIKLLSVTKVTNGIYIRKSTYNVNAMELHLRSQI